MFDIHEQFSIPEALLILCFLDSQVKVSQKSNVHATKLWYIVKASSSIVYQELNLGLMTSSNLTDVGQVP